MSREEVAILLNLKEETVKQIEIKALRKLRKQFLKIDEENNWRSFIFEAKEKDPTRYLYDSMRGM
jgi:DNA-directed RNA polymerase sigma subunit (sigma70/sigma32)